MPSTTYPSPRLQFPSLTLITEQRLDPPVEYALQQLAAFCRASPGIAVHRSPTWGGGTEPVVLVGRGPAEQLAPAACRLMDWPALSDEGFVLKVTRCGGTPVVIAAGQSVAGTRHAVYALLCALDVANSPPSLPADLDRTEKPTFALRGMYAHQHWAYCHPYALRTWSTDEWLRYIDLLALLRVNLFQIWSMAAMLPVPLTPADEAFLRRYPLAIEHARRRHGMQVWIGECANNMCDRRDVAPIAERRYFDVEALKDPANPAERAALRAARAEFYRICDNADGYWVIDSDPGGWKSSPASEFVDLLRMNRELIDAHTQLGREARLIYWMWSGWGCGEPEGNWREVLQDMSRRVSEPWRLTISWDGHWKVAEELGLLDRALFYPYGAVEPEPSLPFTRIVPPRLMDALRTARRAVALRGMIGNAQTPICQLPNIFFFTRAMWNLAAADENHDTAVAELARLIHPEQAGLLTRCWLALEAENAQQADDLASELAGLCETGRLGRPGPIGMQLSADSSQVARDLAEQLRIHAAALRFAQMATPAAGPEMLFDALTRFTRLLLEWRRRTGFLRIGIDELNFPQVRAAAHQVWGSTAGLNERVSAELARALSATYEPWEIRLILDPLR